MLAVVRLRGSINVNRKIEDTMRMLGLHRVNTVSVLPDTPSVRGMIKKAGKFVAWGEVSEEFAHSKDKVLFLKPGPAKKSIKSSYPKGDVGYRKDIQLFLERML